MFRPDSNRDRTDYSGILMPPDGYRLDRAVGTTYSLDLEALTAVAICLGLSEETDSKLMQNPIGMLNALQKVSDKIVLFCEAGQIKVPTKPTALSILLEKMVVEVALPKDRQLGRYPAFHPKTWILAYVNAEGDKKYRFVVMSRNLTFDRSWDISFAMDSSKNVRQKKKTQPICDFLDYLVTNVHNTSNNAGKKRNLIRGLCADIKDVSFSLDSKIFGEDFEVLPLGIGKNAYRMQEDILFCKERGNANSTFNELVVMSPFLSESVIADFNLTDRALSDCKRTLVTRRSELGKLKASDVDNFTIYALTLHLRDVIKISEKEKIKITEMCVPTNGELCSSDTACSGDIVILPNDVLQLNSILGNEILLPQRKFIENPLPMLQTTIAAKKSEQREILLGALTEISDGDPLLKYYVDTTTHEIILSFLGKVQMEVICAILEEKYHVEAEIKEPTVIYMERPLRKAEYTIHIEVPPNPFWASVGLSIEPLPIGSGVQYESRVSLGYLNQSFQNAVMEGVLYGCEQGLYGWKVTDCKICFEYGLYYSPVSTPADFRLLSPIVLEQALKKAGTELLEPYLHFEIYAPQEYLSRAYHDAPRYCADIVSTQIKNDEVILKGEIPARCIQEYRNDLTYFTNGQGVCLTELKGYQPAIGKFICQPRRPNSRIDKVRHMFHKLA